MNTPIEAILNFAQELIRIPTQAGVDSCVPALDRINIWLSEQGLKSKMLNNAEGDAVAILCEIQSDKDGPTYCLNACVDTAPFGDLALWIESPLSGEIKEGWLYGRGSADSKIAISLFSHLAAQLQKETKQLKGNLSIIFDVDEHTGNFEGIKAYIASAPSTADVFIGYPGQDTICVGARGFLRAKIKTYGLLSHSGSTDTNAENAVTKATHLIRNLEESTLPTETDPNFGRNPKLSITGIHGGSSFTVIPDSCEIDIDMRITPSFDKDEAINFLRRAIETLDQKFPSRRPTSLEVLDHWPAYRLDSGSPMVVALQEGITRSFGKSVPLKICGPSNIGNYLNSLGIEATCGFGVNYKNVHAPNECIEIASIGPVFEAYWHALLCLMKRDGHLRK